MTTPASQDRQRGTPAALYRHRRALLLTLVFLALTLIRTHEIGSTFRLLGDQIRDWRIALGAFGDLPLVGPPSVARGTTLGPVYYWFLWLVRVTIGPLVDNLPHAGGIGTALLQSTADVILLWAIRQRLGSWPVALAIVGFFATGPYDIVLSASIWNPPVAVAFSKLSMAAVLLRKPGAPSWQGGAIVALAWLAVQAHSTAVFVAAPVIAWVLVAPIVEQRDVRRAGRGLRLALEVVLLLQVPYLVHHLTTPGTAVTGTRFSEAVDHFLREPSSVQLPRGAEAVRSATGHLLFHPAVVPYGGLVLLGAALLACARFRRDVPVLVTSVAPVACAVAVGSLWRGRGFESYWFLTLMPAMACTLILAACGDGRARLDRLLSVLALVAVAASIPFRAQAAWSTQPMREYGPLVRGSRVILKRAPEVRAIRMPGLHGTTDPAFVYEALGGRLSPSAPFVATIAPSGDVRFERVR